MRSALTHTQLGKSKITTEIYNPLEVIAFAQLHVRIKPLHTITVNWMQYLINIKVHHSRKYNKGYRSAKWKVNPHFINDSKSLLHFNCHLNINRSKILKNFYIQQNLSSLSPHYAQRKENLRCTARRNKPVKALTSLQQARAEGIWSSLLPLLQQLKILNPNSLFFHCCNTTVIRFYTALRNRFGHLPHEPVKQVQSMRIVQKKYNYA